MFVGLLQFLLNKQANGWAHESMRQLVEMDMEMRRQNEFQILNGKSESKECMAISVDQI